MQNQKDSNSKLIKAPNTIQRKPSSKNLSKNKFILLSAMFLLFASNHSLTTKANNISKQIDEQVSVQLKKSYPSVSKATVLLPSFLNSLEGHPTDIKVYFPTGIHEDKLVAQVWINRSGEEFLYAVPVKVSMQEDKDLVLANVIEPKYSNKYKKSL